MPPNGNQQYAYRLKKHMSRRVGTPAINPFFDMQSIYSDEEEIRYPEPEETDSDDL